VPAESVAPSPLGLRSAGVPVRPNASHHPRRSGHLPRVLAGDLRSPTAALSLSVHQLYELRPTLVDHPATAVRSAANLDARLSHVRRLPGRIRASRRPPVSRSADRLSGVRSALTLLDHDGQAWSKETWPCAGPSARSAQAGSWPSKDSAGSAGRGRDERGGSPAAARSQTAAGQAAGDHAEQPGRDRGAAGYGCGGRRTSVPGRSDSAAGPPPRPAIQRRHRLVRRARQSATGRHVAVHPLHHLLLRTPRGR